MVGDRLTVYMKRHKITNEVLSDCFGFNGRGNATVGRAKIGKLIQGENVTLPLHAVWKILDLAGIELKKKEGWTV